MPKIPSGFNRKKREKTTLIFTFIRRNRFVVFGNSVRGEPVK